MNGLLTESNESCGTRSPRYHVNSMIPLLAPSLCVTYDFAAAEPRVQFGEEITNIKVLAGGKDILPWLVSMGLDIETLEDSISAHHNSK